MKPRYWSLAVVMILVNYLIFATLFTMLMETDFSANNPTRTPAPIYTPAPAQPIIIVPTPIPQELRPTPTATRVVSPSESNAVNPSPYNLGVIQANSIQSDRLQEHDPRLVAPGPVNIRSGPGLGHDIIGTLNAHTTMRIIGRTADSSWWQIRISSNTTGWISNAVVNTAHVDKVPPAAAAGQAGWSPSGAGVPENARFQYEPDIWVEESGAGHTRFYGQIKDANGNPVNGVSVQARCGSYAVISNPSGTGLHNDSADSPAGFYDLTVDEKAVPCTWVLTIVATDDGKTVTSALSESIPVEITAEKSVVAANWQKNW